MLSNNAVKFVQFPGLNSVRNVQGAPSHPGSAFALTGRGEVLVYDPKAHSSDNSAGCSGGVFSQDLKVNGEATPVVRALENGFSCGSLLSAKFILGDTCET